MTSALGNSTCLLIILFILAGQGSGCHRVDEPTKPTMREAAPGEPDMSRERQPAPAADAAMQEGALPKDAASEPSLQELVAFREQLDQEVWSDEVEAQRHEQVFVQLWDQLRGLDDPFDTLTHVTFDELIYGSPAERQQHELEIGEYPLDGTERHLTGPQWRELLESWRMSGYRIHQTEWHHSRFQPATAMASAESLVSFAIDCSRESPAQRASLRGTLRVTWQPPSSRDETPRLSTLRLENASIWLRDADAPFREILQVRTDARHRRLMPVLVKDLDGNGGDDILLGGLNAIYWNDGHGQLDRQPLTSPEVDMFDAAVLADFAGDAHADLLYVSNDRRPMLLVANESGRFTTPAQPACNVTFEFPKAFTAGDVDGDGDNDVWIGQYKFPYQQGAMPTPFYDANDGFPAALLRNDGNGVFVDVTEAAGLAGKRHRRTYSASLLDLNADGFLDLMTVNDFSGIDVYQNDGLGHFHDVTEMWLSDRHLFGMGHTLADFDLDGQIDLYTIGMSSTTARRLDALQLGRKDHADINRQRAAMGYGNRLLLNQSNATSTQYVQPAWNDRVARTGWSWGTTSTDFDNDGDPDIYVANGHTSGRSAKDYCTRYWCHDVYTGNSAASPALAKLFDFSLQDFRNGEISWNGFEHNVLWLNERDGNFSNVAFLLGVGFEFDSRAVVSDDLDNDGRRDLLVVRFQQDRAGAAEYSLHALRNELPATRHWIGFRLSESMTGRSPLGATVELKLADGSRRRQVVVSGDSFSSQHAAVVHFGLGDNASPVQSATIHWMDGTIKTFELPEADRYHFVTPQAEPGPQS